LIEDDIVTKVLEERTGNVYELGHRWTQHKEAHNIYIFMQFLRHPHN